MTSQRIASGRTQPGDTAWQPYSGVAGIFLDVNTSSGNFSNTSTPVYTTSIGGDSHHWATVGATSIYLPTATGFRVYVKWVDGSSLTPSQANSLKWHINWIGVQS